MDHLPAVVGTGSKDEGLQTLAVVITTSSAPLSGTSDDVWLDVGPRAWKLGSDFPTGSTRMFQIDVNHADPAIDIPELVPLTVGDITQVRIDKKGLCGLTNAPDSLAALALPSVPKPADLVDVAQKQVALMQYALDREKAALDVEQGVIDHATAALLDANNKLTDAVTKLSTLPTTIANIQNQIVGVQKQLLKVPQFVVHQVCQSNTVKVGICIFNPFACLVTQVVCHNETAVNSAWQTLTDTVTNLEKTINDLNGQVQSATLQKVAALQNIAVETPIKAQAEAQKAALQLQYQVAQQALAVARDGLAEAKKLAAQLPSIPNLPKPGELNIDRVRLIANGREIASFDVHDRLRQGHPSWARPVIVLSPEEQYVRHLRVNINQQSSWQDEVAGSVSTIFKIAGISGWEQEPVETARIVGTLRNRPSPGTDGYVSLDLELERVEARNYGFVLDNVHGILHRRYIRIEYKHLNPNGVDDERYKNWHTGQRFAVEGPACRDTDRLEFSELHPTQANQVVPLRPEESGATPSMVLFFRRLTSSTSFSSGSTSGTCNAEKTDPS